MAFVADMVHNVVSTAPIKVRSGSLESQEQALSIGCVFRRFYQLIAESDSIMGALSRRRRPPVWVNFDSWLKQPQKPKNYGEESARMPVNPN